MNFVQEAFFWLNMVHHFIKCPLWEHHKSMTYINLVIFEMVYDLMTSFTTKSYKFFQVAFKIESPLLGTYFSD